MSVNIIGLDKVKLLKALWENQIVASYFALIEEPSFDYDLAKRVTGGYIDYFQGRAIKCNLSGDFVNPRLYDRDAGNGKFQAVVNHIKEI